MSYIRRSGPILWTLPYSANLTLRQIGLILMLAAIGLAAVYARWRALRRVKDQHDTEAVLHADSWYGLAALLWVGTGVMRAFGGLEEIEGSTPGAEIMAMRHETAEIRLFVT